MNAEMNVALIFAGGCGTRMDTATPKQFLEMLGKPVLSHTLEIFQRHPLVHRIRIVAQPPHFAHTQDICRRFGITKFASLVEDTERLQRDREELLDLSIPQFV